jgi:hypothetical protein
MLSAIGQATVPYGVALRLRSIGVGNATALVSNSNTAYIKPNIRMTKSTSTNDTSFSDLWAVKDSEPSGVKSDSAWAQSTG